MLHHPARRAAGAATCRSGRRGRRGRPCPRAAAVAGDVGRPARSAPPNRGTGRRRWRWPARMSSMPMTCWHSDANSTAGSRVFASFWVETITARAPLSSRMCWWSRVGVGGVGRHGDAARGHDREVGDQPFRPVLADQHHPVAGSEARAACRLAASAATCRAASRPADRPPLAARACAHRKGLSPFSAARVKNIVTRFGKCSSCRAIRSPQRFRRFLAHPRPSATCRLAAGATGARWARRSAMRLPPPVRLRPRALPAWPAAPRSPPPADRPPRRRRSPSSSPPIRSPPRPG